MPELSALHKEKTVAVEFEGETIQVRFRPGLVTTNWQQAAAKVKPEDPDELYSLLCEVVSGWDLTEEGKPFPVSVESLRRLPLRLVYDITAAIIDDAMPKKPKSEA